MRYPKVSLKTDFEKSVIRKATRPIVAVVTTYQADAELFLATQLEEFDRLDWDVVWHINNMSDRELLRQILDHPRTIGYSLCKNSKRPYQENDRAVILEMAQNSGASWAVLHDSDETWEPRAPKLILSTIKGQYRYMAHWLQVWEVRKDGTLMIRVDPPFIGYRQRFYPLTGPCKFFYTAGVPTHCPHSKGPVPPRIQSGIRILHWGFSTQSLRERHYQFWHGRYNDSKFWERILHQKAITRPFDPALDHSQWLKTL